MASPKDAKDVDAAGRLLAEDAEDGLNRPASSPGSAVNFHRIFLATGAICLAFACGALAVSFPLRAPTAPQRGVPTAKTAKKEDDVDRWMKNPSVVETPSMMDVKELVDLMQDVFPDGGVFDHVKYLDVDNSNPQDVKFKLKPSVFKDINVTAATTSGRRLQEDVSRIDTMKKLNLALCGLDGFQSLVTIGQLVTNIRTVTKACKSPYPYDEAQQTFCAAMVQLNIALWGYLAIYIEDAVSSCGPAFSLNAGCSIDITGFITNGALAGAAAANMKSSCIPRGGYKEDQIANLKNLINGDDAASTRIRASSSVFSLLSQQQLTALGDFLESREEEEQDRRDRFQVRSTVGRGAGRRLEEEDIEEAATLPADPVVSSQDSFGKDIKQIQEGTLAGLEQVARNAKGEDKEFLQNKVDAAADRMGLSNTQIKQAVSDAEERKWMHAACGLDLSKSAARLAQFGVLVAMAEKDCGEYNFATNGKQGKTKCAIDVTGAIASAGIAASLMTISVINCPATLEFSRDLQDRLCAAAIIDLISAVSYISTSIASVQGTCGSLDNYPGVPGT